VDDPTRREEKADAIGLFLDELVESLEMLIAQGDRVVLEGDNQKQADFSFRVPWSRSIPRNCITCI
jgi:hypothetical protein